MNKKVIIYTYAFNDIQNKNTPYREFIKKHYYNHYIYDYRIKGTRITFVSIYEYDEDFDSYLVDEREVYIPYDNEEIEIYKKAFELVCDKLGFELDLSDLEKIQNMEWYLQKAKKEVESGG